MPGWENKAVVWWPGSLDFGCGEGRRAKRRHQQGLVRQRELGG